jgi:hypothetical protein
MERSGSRERSSLFVGGAVKHPWRRQGVVNVQGEGGVWGVSHAVDRYI